MSEPSTTLDRVRPLLRTRQVREFTDEPLTDEELSALADVARWSGTAGNSQLFRFVVIRDVATLRRLAEVAAPQTRSLQTATAALAIVWPLADRDVVDAYDDGRVAERVLIGAGMLGLAAGIGWIRPDVRAAVGEVLGLPADRYVRTIVALGHPTEAARQPKSAPGQARLPRDEVVFEERWPG
jgi:nitroreductase